jgi:hypothetical protein
MIRAVVCTKYVSLKDSFSGGNSRHAIKGKYSLRLNVKISKIGKAYTDRGLVKVKKK